MGQIDANSEAKVIAIGNQKGGVGKTTNTAHIASALAYLGKKVLVWDLDIHYGLTSHFGVLPQAYYGTFHLLIGERETEEVILTNQDPEIKLPDNLHLIPSSRELEQLDLTLSKNDPFFNRYSVLLRPLEKLKKEYHYIFLDTAPSTQLTTTVAAYISADYFIISTFPDRLAVEGMKNALKDISQAQRKDRNPRLQLLGVVVSDLDTRLKKAREYERLIEDGFREQGEKSRKFETTIVRAAAISRAQALGKTVFQTEPNHRLVKQYISLAQEIEKRIAELEVMNKEVREVVTNG